MGVDRLRHESMRQSKYLDSAMLLLNHELTTQGVQTQTPFFVGSTKREWHLQSLLSCKWSIHKHTSQP